jgi:starvation-inducible outer membrane lipoprotein
MTIKLRFAIGLNLILFAGLVGACGEPEVSDLTYAEVRDAAQGKDAAAYRITFRGKRVAWSGRVVEVKTEHGDDFVEISTLVVDLDGAAPEEDAILQVSASTAEDKAPGQEVTFTALIQNFEWQDQRPLLRLEVGDIE